jgi:hypothetical protein
LSRKPPASTTGAGCKPEYLRANERHTKGFTMRVFVQIDPNKALKAGFDVVGKQRVKVKAANLDREQRDELAKHYNDGRSYILGAGFVETLGDIPDKAEVADKAEAIRTGVVDGSEAGIKAAIEQYIALRKAAAV